MCHMWVSVVRMTCQSACVLELGSLGRFMGRRFVGLDPERERENRLTVADMGHTAIYVGILYMLSTML